MPFPDVKFASATRQRAALDGAAFRFGPRNIPQEAILTVTQMTRPQISIRRTRRASNSVIPRGCPAARLRVQAAKLD
jgi:hypothetical protein